MVHLLRTTAVSRRLPPPTSTVFPIWRWRWRGGGRTRLDGVSRVNMRIDERPQEMRAALTSPLRSQRLDTSWNRSISALVLNSVVEEVRAETNGGQAEIRFLFRRSSPMRVLIDLEPDDHAL